MDGYTRLCKGCSEPLSVPLAGKRGSDRLWCSERCRQQRLKDVRLLELHDLIQAGTKASLERAAEFLAPQWRRAMEREGKRAARQEEFEKEQAQGSTRAV